MQTLEVLHNDNGNDYKYISVLEFNNIDKEYYKNSWQKHAVALLEQVNGNYEKYVVARYVGETSWGYGSYFENLDDAIKYYNLKVKEYKKS